jgi:surface polysaccharide O-acyltransferase-like enzyme
MAALHPAGVGLILLVSGLLADTENAKRRMLWMHIAVTYGLIGFLITLVGVIRMSLNGAAAALPLVFAERAIVTVVCLAFVAACVRSFISARRSRTAA